jgi:hypothetical protein
MEERVRGLSAVAPVAGEEPAPVAVVRRDLRGPEEKPPGEGWKDEPVVGPVEEPVARPVEGPVA